MADTPLAELLGDEPPAPEQAEAKVEETAPEPETPSEQPEPAPQEEQKAEADEPPAVEAPQPEPKAVPLAALQEERAKRQDLERRLREIEEAKAKEPEPDFFEDPTGALKRFEQKIEERSVQERIAISEEMMIDRVGQEKWDQALTAFESAVSENPALAAQMRGARNPAKFAYDYGNKTRLMKEMGDDPQAYRDRLKAEVMAELKAELAKEQPAASLPKTTSLAGAKSESGLKTPAWDGPAPLSDLLPS